MTDNSDLLKRLRQEIYDDRAAGPGPRFTQDSPILPDIWETYAARTGAQVDLILSPFNGENAGAVARDLRVALEDYETTRETRLNAADPEDRQDNITRAAPRIAHIPGLIVTSVYFEHLVSLILPSTRWWAMRMGQLGRAIETIQKEEGAAVVASPVDLPLSWSAQYAPLQNYVTRWIDETWAKRDHIADRVARFETRKPRKGAANTPPPYDFLKMVRIVGLIALGQQGRLPAEGDDIPAKAIVAAFNALFKDRVAPPKTQNTLWGASRNRPGKNAMIQSAKAMKADAARKLFDLSGTGQKWAIIDSGIDGHHPAFSDWRARDMQGMSRPERPRLQTIAEAGNRPSRVLRTYDFDGLRDLLDVNVLQTLKIELTQTAAREDWSDHLSGVVHARERTFGEAIDELKNTQSQSAADRYSAERWLRTARCDRARAQGLRRLINAALLRGQSEGANTADPGRTTQRPDVTFEVSIIDALLTRLKRGMEIDWSAIEVLVEDVAPPAPVNNHGTNVAAILGANWMDDVPTAHFEPDEMGHYSGLQHGEARATLVGICPEIELLDFRVVTETDDGVIAPHDFEVIAAMKMINHLNRRAENITIHGANLSIAIEHNVRSFACGRTPICEECDRLSASGVVVVAAAGNSGYSEAETFTDRFYRHASISDPGNAEGVITVGATHRSKPHEYGVSFFSSRGPTGDGRAKPDLVAPGEKITTASPGEMSSVVDGTSFSAPHVAAAAALLMERNSELVGKPHLIKRILCDAATDLGRERHFQGAGMLDILRALQSL